MAKGLLRAVGPAITSALMLPAWLAAQEPGENGSQGVDVSAGEYGERNPAAPPELERFAFLIGEWRCESRIKSPQGGWTSYPARWVGRYILDGYVIADEFRQYGPEGELVQLGKNFRSYDRARGVWEMRWLDAMRSTWLELGPEELGGVEVTETSITFQHRVPEWLAGDLFPENTLFRIGFLEIRADHFSWRAEVSTDGGATWELVQTIEAERAR